MLLVKLHCSKRTMCLISLNSKPFHFPSDRATDKSLYKYVAFALVSDPELLHFLGFC